MTHRPLGKIVGNTASFQERASASASLSRQKAEPGLSGVRTTGPSMISFFSALRRAAASSELRDQSRPFRMKRHDRADRSSMPRCGSDHLFSRKVQINRAAHSSTPALSGAWMISGTPNWAHLNSTSWRGRRKREAREPSGSPDSARLFKTTRSPRDQLRGERGCVTVSAAERRFLCGAKRLTNKQPLERCGRASQPPTRPGKGWQRGRLSQRGNTLRVRGGHDVPRVEHRGESFGSQQGDLHEAYRGS